MPREIDERAERPRPPPTVKNPAVPCLAWASEYISEKLKLKLANVNIASIVTPINKSIALIICTQVVANIPPIAT